MPKVSSDDRAKLVSFVDRILAAKKRDPSADTTQLEKGINHVVYGLHGLTEQDIAVVEAR